MKTNRIIATIILVLTVGIIIGAVILGVRIFGGKDFNPVFETEGAYRKNGFLYVSGDGEKALYYRAVARAGSTEEARTYIPYEKKSVDLAPYGFAGTLEYFDAEGFAVTPLPEYEGFWPVSTEKRLIFLAPDGVYRLDTERVHAYPVFSDSVEGVDPLAKDVLAFSSGGYYALAFDGKTVKIYVSDDDADSMKIAEVKEKDLSGYGTDLEFHAFVNDRTAFFSGRKEGKITFFALDCGTMNAAVSPLPDARYGELLDRVYLVREPSPEEAADEDEIVLGWTNCLLGEERTASLSREEYRGAKILSVSPQGNYAILRAEKTDGSVHLVVTNGKKAVSFTEKAEGYTVEDLTFSYDNIILAVLKDPEGKLISRGYKICY